MKGTHTNEFFAFIVPTVCTLFETELIVVAVGLRISKEKNGREENPAMRILNVERILNEKPLHAKDDEGPFLVVVRGSNSF